MTTGQSMATLLAGHEFFEGLSDEDLATLAPLASELVMEPRTTIVEEGGPADSIYAIVEGSVALELNVAHRAQHIVQTVHRGEVIGWSWLFPPHRWSFTALALDSTQLIRLDAGQLRALLDDDCALGYEMMKRFARVMTDRLSATRLQLVDFYADRH